jgi:hypothetical protein
MKQLSILLFLIVLISCKQENALLQYKQHFDQELKPWTNSFHHFNLVNFKKGKTLPFENGSPQDLASYKEFIATYRPILTFLPDSSKFIDPYTSQLNLVKVGDHFEASPDDGGALLLCDTAAKYWDRVCYNAPGQWIEEVTGGYYETISRCIGAIHIDWRYRKENTGSVSEYQLPMYSTRSLVLFTQNEIYKNG